jgi:hypothetical protein
VVDCVDCWSKLILGEEDKTTDSREDCGRLLRLEISSVKLKRLALFQMASSATLMSALTCASICAGLKR